MMLMHVTSLGALRQELIESLGKETARGLITRIGYQAGARDAEMAKRLRSASSAMDHFLAGPQLVSLEGIVHCEPIALDIDVGSGRYFGDFALIDCAEAEAHVASYGIGDEPTCWMLVGYACGYTSTFMGRPILWREVECRGMGHDRCRVVGRPVEEWGEGDRDDLRFLQIGDFVKWTAGLAAERDRAPRRPPGRRGQENDFRHGRHIQRLQHRLPLVKKVAPTEATVLFLGESGVGKEIFSQNLHRLSASARNGPFIAVNCAAIPEQLTESELFGVEKGGFTGATVSRPGRFERAHGGTLFLDEIGTLSFTAQGKLLRALQEGEIERVGDTRVRKVDVRVIAATNVNLRDAVRDGSFREDLFFRLNVFPIRVPPLARPSRRHSAADELVHAAGCKKHGKTITGFRERAVDALINYRWPGNVREMENMIERAVILADEGGALDICHLFTAGEEIQRRDLRRAEERRAEGRRTARRGGGGDAERSAGARRHRGAHAAPRARGSRRQSLARLAAAQHQPPDAGLPPAQAQDRGRLTGWTPPARTRPLRSTLTGIPEVDFPSRPPRAGRRIAETSGFAFPPIPGAAAI